MSNPVLKSGGKTYTGFESVQIHRSLLEISGGFALYFSEDFDGEKTPGLKMTLPVTIEIGNKKYLDGYFDTITTDHGPRHSFSELHGRDKTGDLVDCDYDAVPNEWKGQTVKSLITNLCLPFSVPVSVDVSASVEAVKIIESYSVDEGIPVAELINRICRDYGIRAVCYGDGRLTITKAGVKQALDKLIVGETAEAARTETSNINRFSSYTVKGYGTGSDTKTNLSDYIGCSGLFLDANVTRTRTKVIFAEGPTDNERCRNRAISEARIHAGLSRRKTYRVSEWEQTNGTPWEINTLVRVKDPLATIDDTMLILSVDYFYEPKNGSTAVITVVDKSTFNGSSAAIKIKGRFD